MKIIPVYGSAVFVMPQSVSSRLSTSTREELAVLLSVLSNPDVDPKDRAAALNLTEKTFLDALAMWQRCGVLTIADGADTAEAKDVSQRPMEAEQAAEKTESEPEDRLVIVRAHTEKTSRRAKKTVGAEDGADSAHQTIRARRELPHYSSEDMAKYMENHVDVRDLVDCCQNISGEIFSPSAVEIILGLHDYLGLAPEYIMLLFAHAKKLGKTSVRYVETTAIELADEGITSYQDLEERLRAREIRQTMDTFVRKLFGIQTRALIPKEKEMLDNWIFKMHYDRDIIERAYEITVTNTGKPAIAYANKVLVNWHEAGLKTLSDGEEALDAYKKAREGQVADGSSFDTNDFFEAAIRRSYET